MPRVHHSQTPQEFDCQPRPTRWPTVDQLHLRADGRHLADDLVAGNEGILADAPVIGDEMKVAVADAAVGDGDLDLLRAQLAGVVLERQQLCSRRMYCKSLNLAHDYVLNPHEVDSAQNSRRSECDLEMASSLP
jgi:hypothetical protein